MPGFNYEDKEIDPCALQNHQFIIMGFFEPNKIYKDLVILKNKKNVVIQKNDFLITLNFKKHENIESKRIMVTIINVKYQKHIYQMNTTFNTINEFKFYIKNIHDLYQIQEKDLNNMM